MPPHPDSNITITEVTPCGDGRVCISIQLVVDAHHLVEVSGRMLSVAAKGASESKKKK